MNFHAYEIGRLSNLIDDCKTSDKNLNMLFNPMLRFIYTIKSTDINKSIRLE